MHLYSQGHIKLYDGYWKSIKSGLEINFFVWEPAGD